MKKLLSLALVAFLATSTVNAASFTQDPCNKECSKKCDDKCKDACKGGKCTKQECAKKCDNKKECSTQKAS